MNTKLLTLIMVLTVIGLATQPVTATPNSQTHNFTEKCGLSKNVNYSGTITATTIYAITEKTEFITVLYPQRADITINYPEYLSHCWIDYTSAPSFYSLDITLTQGSLSCPLHFDSHTQTKICNNGNTQISSEGLMPIYITGTLIYDVDGIAKDLHYPVNITMS